MVVAPSGRPGSHSLGSMLLNSLWFLGAFKSLLYEIPVAGDLGLETEWRVKALYRQLEGMLGIYEEGQVSIIPFFHPRLFLQDLKLTIHKKSAILIS